MVLSALDSASHILDGDQKARSAIVFLLVLASSRENVYKTTILMATGPLFDPWHWVFVCRNDRTESWK